MMMLMLLMLMMLMLIMLIMLMLMMLMLSTPLLQLPPRRSTAGAGLAARGGLQGTLVVRTFARGCHAIEVFSHQWRCHRSRSSCGTEKSSSSVRRSTYHRPSPSPADNNEEDMEGFLTSAVTEDQCYHLRTTPRYAEHHQFWAGVWSLPCLPRPGFRRW